MCGIAGYYSFRGDISDIETKREFRFLLRAIEERGKEATGVAGITIQGNKKTKPLSVHSIKAPQKAGAFLKTKQYNKWENGNYSIVIGHCRYPTQGKPEINGNNHPVEKGEFVLVHNGMISNDDEVYEYLEMKREQEVDSQVIVDTIDHYHSKAKDKSVMHAIKESCKILDGSWACAMLRAGEKTLWLWRDINPLWLALNEKKQILWFASTVEALANSVGITNYLKFFYLYNELDDDTGLTITDEGISEHDLKVPFQKKIPSWNYQCGGWDGRRTKIAKVDIPVRSALSLEEQKNEDKTANSLTSIDRMVTLNNMEPKYPQVKKSPFQTHSGSVSVTLPRGVEISHGTKIGNWIWLELEKKWCPFECSDDSFERECEEWERSIYGGSEADDNDGDEPLNELEELDSFKPFGTTNLL